MPETQTDNAGRIANIWKWVATMLAGIVIGGFPLFLATNNKVDAAQVKDIVQTESPYSQDKNLIFFKLDQTYSTLKELQGQVKAIQDQLNNLALDPGYTLPGRP